MNSSRCMTDAIRKILSSSWFPKGGAVRYEGPKAGMGFSGMDSQPSPHQLGVWGSTVNSPEGVWGCFPIFYKCTGWHFLLHSRGFLH